MLNPESDSVNNPYRYQWKRRVHWILVSFKINFTFRLAKLPLSFDALGHEYDSKYEWSKFLFSNITSIKNKNMNLFLKKF